MIRVVIIEDETIAARNLERLLLGLDKDIEVVAKIESVKDAIHKLPNLEIDLILMDIHLLDGSAFQIFKNIEIREPIIFTTAFEKYALNAFKQNSVDYLLKPISKHELKNAILKYKTLFESNIKKNIDYKELLTFMENNQTSYRKRFLVQIGKKLHSINIESIAYFFVENKTTFIKTYKSKTYIIDSSLAQLETNTNPDFFFRINRQYLVSRKSIDSIYYQSTTRLKANLIPNSKEIVWVSNDKISKIKKWLDQ